MAYNPNQVLSSNIAGFARNLTPAEIAQIKSGPASFMGNTSYNGYTYRPASDHNWQGGAESREDNGPTAASLTMYDPTSEGSMAWDPTTGQYLGYQGGGAGGMLNGLAQAPGQFLKDMGPLILTAAAANLGPMLGGPTEGAQSAFRASEIAAQNAGQGALGDALGGQLGANQISALTSPVSAASNYGTWGSPLASAGDVQGLGAQAAGGINSAGGMTLPGTSLAPGLGLQASPGALGGTLGADAAVSGALASGAGALGSAAPAAAAASSWIPGVSNAATLLGGANAINGLLGYTAANRAANAQTNAANNATAAQLQMFNTINDQNAPWRQAGVNALGQLGQLTSLPASDPNSMMHRFGASDLNANLAPNYQWSLDQGLGALNNQNTVSGGLMGGNALKGAIDYTQNKAQDAYQQAYNNYNTNQTNIFNRLSNIAGLGNSANQTTAQAGSNTASNVGSSLLAGGAAQAAGIVGGTNALTNGLNNLSSYYMMNNLTGGKLLGQSTQA